MSLTAILFQQMLHNPFVISIVVVGVLTVLSLIKSWFRTALETRGIDALASRCAALKAQRPATQEALFEQLLQGLSPTSLAAERVRLVQDAYRRGQSDLGIDAHAELLADRVHLGLTFARYATSTLVLLGLCGAVFGLYTVVGELASPVDEIQQVLATMPDTISEKYSTKTDPLVQVFGKVTARLKDSLVSSQGAFGASLSGILSTVLVIFLTWIVALACDRMLMKLEDVTRDDLLPLVEVKSSGSALEKLGADFVDGVVFLSDLGNTLTEQTSRMSDVFGSMYAFVEKFSDGAKSLASGNERVGEVQAQLAQLLARFVETADQMKVGQDQSVKAQAELGRLLGDVLARVESQNGALLQMQQRMDEGLQQNVNLLRELFEQRNEALAKSTGNAVNTKLKVVKEIMDGQKQYIEALTEATSTSKAHESLVKGLETLLVAEREGLRSTMVKQQDGLQQALVGALQSEGGHFERLNRNVESQIQSLHEAKDSNERLALAVRESLGDLGRRMQNLSVGQGGGAPVSHKSPLSRLYPLAALTTPAVAVGCLVVIGRLTDDNVWAVLATAITMAAAGATAFISSGGSDL